MVEYNCDCPSCKAHLEITVRRWNGYTICPQCNTMLYIDFDMIVGEDDEWDFYEVMLFADNGIYTNINGLDKFECIIDKI